MQCMRFYTQISKTYPKILTITHQFWKTPKKYQKPQNLGLNAWNAWRMREKEHIPSDLKQGNAENHVG